MEVSRANTSRGTLAVLEGAHGASAVVKEANMSVDSSSLRVTPVMKWNFERSCYRWLVTTHPALFRRMDFTAQILQSPSLARKAFYESTWEEANVLIRPSVNKFDRKSFNKFERTPFFDCIIGRGLRNKTRFEASMLTEDEVEALGMHHDDSVGPGKLHIRSSRKDSRTNGNASNSSSGSSRGGGKSNNDTNGHKVNDMPRVMSKHRHVGDEYAGAFARSWSHSCFPPRPSPTNAAYRCHSFAQRSLVSSASFSTTSDDHDVHRIPVDASCMPSAKVAFSCRPTGGEKTPQAGGGRVGVGCGSGSRGADTLSEHRRSGCESMWRPSSGRIREGYGPSLGMMGLKQNPRRQEFMPGDVHMRVTDAAMGRLSEIPEAAGAHTPWQRHDPSRRRADGSMWVGQGPPRSGWSWSSDDFAVATGGWKRVARGDAVEQAAGNRFGEATRTGSVSVAAGARLPRADHLPMKIRHLHDGGDCRNDRGDPRNGGGCGGSSSSSGHRDASQSAVKREPRFVRQPDRRGPLNMSSTPSASSARAGRDSCAPAPGAPGSGNSTLLSLGYMRLAAMEKSGHGGGCGGCGECDVCVGGGGRETFTSPSSHKIQATGVGRSASMFPCNSDRSHRVADRSVMADAETPSVSPKKPKTKEPSTEACPRLQTPSRGSRSLPSISQIIPGVCEPQQATEATETCTRRRSFSEDRARPLKKRRHDSPASGSKSTENKISAQTVAVEKGETGVSADDDRQVGRDSTRDQDPRSLRRHQCDPMPVCDQREKESPKNKRESSSDRSTLDPARKKYGEMSHALRVNKEQTPTAAGRLGLEGFHTLRERNNPHSSPRSFSVGTAETENRSASSSDEERTPANPSSAKSNSFVDHSPGHSANRSSSPENWKNRHYDNRPAGAATVAEEVVRDCGAEVEILAGLGKDHLAPSSRSSSRLHPKIDSRPAVPSTGVAVGIPQPRSRDSTTFSSYRTYPGEHSQRPFQRTVSTAHVPIAVDTPRNFHRGADGPRRNSIAVSEPAAPPAVIFSRIRVGRCGSLSHGQGRRLYQYHHNYHYQR